MPIWTPCSTRFDGGTLRRLLVDGTADGMAEYLPTHRRIAHRTLPPLSGGILPRARHRPSGDLGVYQPAPSAPDRRHGARKQCASKLRHFCRARRPHPQQRRRAIAADEWGLSACRLEASTPRSAMTSRMIRIVAPGRGGQGDGYLVSHRRQIRHPERRGRRSSCDARRSASTRELWSARNASPAAALRYSTPPPIGTGRSPTMDATITGRLSKPVTLRVLKGA